MPRHCCKTKKFRENVKFCEDVTIQGNLRVKENLTVRGDIEAQNISATNTISAPIGQFSIIRYPNPVTVIVDPALEANGITVFNRIQDAIDAYSGRQVEQLRIDVAPGIYDENLRFDLLAAGGNRTAGIVGDARRIAGMSYVNGDFNAVRSGNIASVVVAGQIVTYNPPLGTRGGKVQFVQTTGNDLTVTISAAPLADPDAGNVPGIIINPDFTSAAVGPVVAGDKVMFTFSNGDIIERTIVEVSSNRIVFDGTPLVLTGFGTSITFLPNVQVRPTTPTSLVPPFPSIPNALPAFYFAGTSNLNVTGIRFTRDPTVLVSGFFSVMGIIGCSLEVDNCVVDDPARRSNTNLFISDNATIFVNRVFTIIGSTVGYDSDSDGIVWAGDLYVLGQGNAGITTAFAGKIYASGIHVANPAGLGINVQASSTVGATRLISCINCFNGLNLADDSTSSCATTNYYLFGRGTGTAILAARGSEVSAAVNDYYNQGVVINGFARGIVLSTGSQFAAANIITIQNTTTPYVSDQSSQFATDNNTTGTYPSPGNVLTVTSSGPLIPAYLTQLITGAGPIALTLNPALVVAGVSAYQGKTFTIVKQSLANHTLALTGAATFGGEGSGSTATFTGPVGAYITFTVVSGTLVVVLASSGVSFA